MFLKKQRRKRRKLKHKQKAKELEDFVKSRPPYFWWLLANLLALAFAIISWTSCYYLFNNPQTPENYKLLTKLKRIKSPQAFVPFDAPQGRGDNPETLYGKYIELPDKKLDALNRERLLNYIYNFKKDNHTTYAKGDYRITHVRALGENDFIQKGVVVRARAFIQQNEYEDATPYPLVIEYLFPTDVSDAVTLFRVGDMLTVERLPQCPYVLHVEKLDLPEEPTVCVTIVPLCYGKFVFKDSKGTPRQDALPLSVPKTLNLKPGFPVMKENRL